MKAHKRVLLVSREPQGGQIEQWRAMSHACSSLIGDHRKRDTGHFKSRRFERSRPIFPGPRN
jgi:hypothetical protein